MWNGAKKIEKGSRIQTSRLLYHMNGYFWPVLATSDNLREGLRFLGQKKISVHLKFGKGKREKNYVGVKKS